MDEEKPQKRKKSDRLKKGEVKKRIIEIILDNRSDRYGNVLESDIRKSLESSKMVSAQAIINRHLNDLYNLGCIESTGSEIPKSKNKWNVKNIRNLMRIRENFKDIRLNSYKKSL